MKRIFLFVVVCVFYAGFLVHGSPRLKFSINETWKFFKGDFQNAASIQANDSDWEIISFPHTWNNKDTDDETPGFYRGTGWYRRNLDIPTSMNGKQIFIYFEGANQETEVYVNGALAGIHSGGYTRFCFNITTFIKTGEKNMLAIKVSNRFNENIPPLSADFTFFGGIYRDVYLLVTENQHIATEHFASSGVFITTPHVNENESRVTIKTILTNDAVDVATIRLENSIYSNIGKVIFTRSTPVKTYPNENKTIEIKDVKIEHPELWSPDSPVLYTVVTRLYDTKTNRLLDEVSEPLGFRWYEFSVDKGFLLNGKSLKLIGTNRHQCYFEKGNALTDEMHVRDIKLLKDMGGNFLRVSHYPQDPTVMEMCDKLGIICSVEIPVVNEINASEGFTTTTLNMAREMVMQEFNHPSVLVWAYMNEVLLKMPVLKDSVEQNAYLFAVKTLAQKLEKQITEDDPSRYTLISFHANFDIYQKAGLTLIPKLLGWNLYQGWYSGSFEGFGNYLDQLNNKLPSKPMIITEYGADVDPRLHSLFPQRFDYTAEYANLYHEFYIKAIMERKYVVGATIWNLNDFYSEDRVNAVPHVNSKGITTLTRELKDTYLQYRAILSKTPVLSIGGMNWKIRGGNADKNGQCFQPVKIYTNQPDVELFVNGKSVGKQLVNNYIAQFNVPFVNGLNLLDACSAKDNTMIRDQLKIDFRAVPYNLKSETQPFASINVMLGSKRYFEDKTTSVIWLPEQEYKPGSWGYVGGSAYEKKTKFGVQPGSDFDVLGTTNDPVFQTMRTNIGAFKLDVPNGTYTITMYWAELQTEKERQSLYNLGNDAVVEKTQPRSFNVSINGQTVLKNFNIAEQYGELRAIDKKFVVDVRDGIGISINFEKNLGEPVLNAIRVYRNY